LLETQGRLDEAEPLRQEVIEEGSIWVARIPHTLTSINNLAPTKASWA